ncbi:MAG: UDP-N-acetylmuramate dehydrogenase [Saprospiraceae bacterium]
MEELKSLKPYNTFGLDVKAKNYYPIYSEHDVYYALSHGVAPYFVLGGGSNILLTSDIEESVLHNMIKGINVIDEDNHQILVEVGAGEIWHNFVLWSIAHNLYGLENLSLIPGTVGAAPIQNIGAYGVEQSNNFHSLKCIDLESGESTTYYKKECNFGYRDSLFKTQLKGKKIITRVRYLLSKTGKTNIEYGDIKNELINNGIDPSVASINEVSDAVTKIRRSKLPEPSRLPNSGSFFKNPIVSNQLLNDLLVKFPNLVYYHIDEFNSKLAAGWLVEQCGFKGKEINGVACHEKQALVIVKTSENATGKDILNYSQAVINEVFEKFNVRLMPEVNIYPNIEN